ncbi:MAG: protein kinase [Polyangiaceae bacterium]|nr:protein kinase [Polyangiaceae bacterium]
MLQPEDRSGSLLGGKWRLLRKLGEGGMGAVYLARHERNGKRAAIKMLQGVSALDDEGLARFHREGYIANLIDSPNVAQIYDDDFSSDGVPYLVMELLEGETVDDRAVRAGGRLPWEEVAEIADAVLGVLQAAHALGVVHRDLKPANLFLTSKGIVKVLDFGLASLRVMSADQKRLTATGTPAMGTVGFMPPEQARGEWDLVDARSDLWAMGATMFSVLAGCDVHEGDNVYQLYTKAITEPARPLASVAPSVPAALAAIVDRALRFDRAERFASAEEMRAALRAAVAPSDVATPRPGAAIASFVDEPTLSMGAPPAAAPPRLSAAAATSHSVTLEANVDALGETLLSESGGAPRPPERRRSRWMLFALGGVAVGLVAVAGAQLYVSRRPIPAPAAANSHEPSAPAASLEPTSPTASAVAPTGVAPSAATSSSVNVHPVASSDVAAPPVHSAANRRVSGSARVTPTTAPSASPAPAPSATIDPAAKPDLNRRK